MENKRLDILTKVASKIKKYIDALESATFKINELQEENEKLKEMNKKLTAKVIDELVRCKKSAQEEINKKEQLIKKAFFDGSKYHIKNWEEWAKENNIEL